MSFCLLYIIATRSVLYPRNEFERAMQGTPEQEENDD